MKRSHKGNYIFKTGLLKRDNPHACSGYHKKLLKWSHPGNKDPSTGPKGDWFRGRSRKGNEILNSL